MGARTALAAPATPSAMAEPATSITWHSHAVVHPDEPDKIRHPLIGHERLQLATDAQSA